MPFPFPGSPVEAKESMKQLAKRPKPPFPMAISGSILATSSSSIPKSFNPSRTVFKIPKLSKFDLSIFPGKNSIEK